ncbi:MAG: hypothetical protein L0211_26685 [Planctomycetaceae bacterium]|nr:hypothetical protein [Planctomycetaceae bacterium]
MNTTDATATTAPATTSQSAPPDDAAPAAPLISPRRARIDGPHLMAGASTPGGPSLLEVIEEPPADLVAAVTGQSEVARREQLELQSDQLSEHLRERLREVDRREAQLNARVAQLESDLRTSRVWLREQEHEFAEREADLRRQLYDAQVRGETGTAAAEAVDLDQAHAELADRERQLQLKENDLRERRFEIERQASALRHALQLWEQERARQETALARERERLAREFEQKSADRDQQLAAAERLVAQQSEQLVRDRAELSADGQAWDQRRRDQAQALDDQASRIDAELANHRQRLEGRAEWIERQRAGLEQVRGEITALHRQSLEMRLIAEQLWAQISGRMSPAEVAHAIAQLRLKLAEHYRLEEQSLDAKKQELVQLGERIAQQHRELAQLQGGLKDWSAARQAEIEEHAANLVRREQELEDQQDAFRQARGQWQTERLAYEQQLRELRAQLRGQPIAA